MSACWNRNSVSTGDINCYDGAIVLQIQHWALVCLMLAPNLGKNNRCLAFASILFTPWYAEWSDFSVSAWSCWGMRILLPFIGAPSRQYIFLVYGPENTSYGWEFIAWLGGSHFVQNLLRYSILHLWPPWLWSFPMLYLSTWVTSIYQHRGRFNSTVDRLGWINHNCLKRLMYWVLLHLCCWHMIVFARVLRWGTNWVSGYAVGCHIEFSGIVFNMEWNFYISVCSLKFNRRGFFIFSRTWSENILVSSW